MIGKEQNRAWAMTMAVAAVLLCSGCSENLASSTAQTTAAGTTAASSEKENETTMAEEADNVTAMPLTNTEERVDCDEDDYTSTYDTFDAEIQLNSNTAAVTGSAEAVQVAEHLITIQKGGTYRISGTWKNGQLRVTGSEKVKLYLGDGLNAGGGNPMGMGFPMQETTDSTTNADDTAENHNITISGGTIYICADGDGIDANGGIVMTGGTVFVSGPVSGGDGALDFETDMTMSGGSILALSNRGMMEYPSTPHYCTTNVQAQAGDFIAVCDANGNVLMGMQTTKEVSDVVYYGEQMENCQLRIGGTYQGTLSKENTAVDGTISGGTTVEFDLTDGTEQDGFSQGQFGNGGMHPDFGRKPDFAEGELPEPPQDGFDIQNGAMLKQSAETSMIAF